MERLSLIVLFLLGIMILFKPELLWKMQEKGEIDCRRYQEINGSKIGIEVETWRQAKNTWGLF